MAGQIFFGVGWGALYFFFCCPWLGWVGVAALVIGLGLLALWFMQCQPAICTVWKELAWVLAVVVAPVVALILLYPPALACALGSFIAALINAVLTLVSAAIVGTALLCSD